MARGSTNAFLTGATGGLGRLAQTLAGARQARQDAFDQELGLQSKLAKSLAEADKAQADAELNYQKRDIINRRPQLFRSLGANASGVDVPTFDAYLQSLEGNKPMVPMGPPDETGGMGVGSFQAGEQTRPRLASAVDRLAPVLLNTGDFDEKKWADAAETYRNMGLGDQVLRGERTAGQVGAAQAAVKGSELFKADAGGGVLGIFGGSMDTNNPLAQSTLALRREQAAAQKANAAQSYAAADSSRATASKTRAETTAMGPGGGAFRAPTGFRWKADGSGLEPIPGGPADPNAKNSKPPAEVQRMNVALRALEDGLTRYEQILGEFDPRSFDQLDPSRKAQIESLTADLRMQMKEAQALGALTGPDMQILDQMLTNPATARGAMFGRDGLTRQVSEARLSLQRRRNALGAEFNQPAQGGPGAPGRPGGVPAGAPGQPSLADLAAAELARRGNK